MKATPKGQPAMFRALKPLASSALACLLATSAVAAQAVTDCPLRDEPFSVDLPLLDILASPAARTALEGELPELFQGLPPQMLKPEVPSFTALMTVRQLARMRRLPPETIDRLAQVLTAVPVTAADKAQRCARYDNDDPGLTLPEGALRILVFTKITGFDHGEGVTAATAAIETLAARQGWGVAVTDKAGAFTAERLRQFDVVVWNNVSGDVLTLSQREAFRNYIQNGGGFVGIHGAAGDPVYFWQWYADELLAARFIGHPADPQFQTATLHMETTPTGIGASLPTQWTLSDEWYSFRESPRKHEASVVATLDESSYEPVGHGGQDLRMGDDHPIVWARCVGGGRSFYSALGHRPETYEDANHLALLADGLRWAGGYGAAVCRDGQLVLSAHGVRPDQPHPVSLPAGVADDMATGQGATGVGSSTVGSDVSGALQTPPPAEQH